MNRKFKKHISLKLLAIFIGISFCLNVVAQDVSRQLQKPVPKTLDQIERQWEQSGASIKMSFANSNVHYERERVPQINIQLKDTLYAWKGEKVHTQMLIWGGLQTKVSVIPGKLFLKNAVSVPVQAGMIDYVLTDEFGQGCGYRKTTDFDSFYVEDRIKIGDLKTDLPAKTVQPIWLSVQVPENAQQGLYKATVTINADKKYTAELFVKVGSYKLPPPDKWSFNLDLWQHPAAIARVHHVKLWSEEHFKLMKPYYTMLAKAGQKNITASIVNEPWNHQTYDDYPSLVKWIKKKDGSWKYDYSLFDKYVQFVMDCGIKAHINCYSMIPWKIAFEYFDEASGGKMVFTNAAGSQEYHDFWKPMLIDFTKHLKQKGWFGKTTIAMDERPMKSMQAVIQLLKEVDKNWKIALAGDYHPEIEPDIFDYCVASRWKFPDEVLRKRHAEGKLSTWYTCCTEPYPNGFTFSSPAEHVWIGWYTAAQNMDGYLRWAYNSWPAHPDKDSRFITWPAGDTYQVYPGPNTSIRFEKLIEGIQDFEKIKILKGKFTNDHNDKKLEELNEILSAFEIGKLSKETAEDMVDGALQKLKKLE